MTNEEAIEEIRNFWTWFCCTYPHDEHANWRISNALGLAVDALGKCEDFDPYLADWHDSGLGMSDEQALAW